MTLFNNRYIEEFGMGKEEIRCGQAGSEDPVFTANDMLLAFKHGIGFEQLEATDGSEIDFGNYDEKHWLPTYVTNIYVIKAPEECSG